MLPTIADPRIKPRDVPTPSSWAWVWLVLAVLIAGVTLSFRMNRLPLLSPDEGRNAEVAREMMESGAWLVPAYNQVPYLDKPAFYFRVVAASLSVFGINEFAARLPSLLFGVAILGLAWGMTRREWGPRPAAWAVLVIATLPLFISQARIVIFDIALCLFVSSAIFSGYLAESGPVEGRRKWLLTGAAAAGLATLVKGPVGLLVPLAVLLTFHALERRWGAMRRLFHPLQALVFLALVLPWFLGVTAQHPDFPDYGLVQESFKRFTTTQFHRTAPFYFYAWVVPAMFFPWSLLLPGASWIALRRWKSLSAFTRLLITWCVVVVVFFSLSKSKLPGYVLSVTVPFGILVAQLIEQAIGQPQGRAARLLRFSNGFLSGMAVVLLLALVVVAPQTHLLPHPLQIPKIDVGQFSPFLVPVLVMLALVAVINGAVLFLRRLSWSSLGLASVPTLVVVFGAGVFLSVFDSISARPIAVRLQTLSPDTELVFYRCYPNGLPFYLQRTGTLITAEGDELTSNYVLYTLKREPRWPAPIVPLAEAGHFLEQRHSKLYVIAKDHDRAWLQEQARRWHGTIEELPHHFLGMLVERKPGS